MRLRYDISRIDNAKTENIFICNINSQKFRNIGKENIGRKFERSVYKKYAK